MARGQIVKVSGPLVVAEGMADATMFDMVRVGKHRLIGEIIELHGDLASIQVYEDTSGLAPGAVVDDSGAPLSVELGPGLLETIYDGIQRPLEVIRQQSGATIQRGVETASLDRDRHWHFIPCVTPGTALAPGDIIGTVQETVALEHRIMVPPGISGTVTAIHTGDFHVTDPVCELDNGKQLTLMQRWPVRTGRPYRKKLPPTQPLETGQRVIDTFFPLAKGGTACVPGPFGAGKTVIQHQLAKWSDVDLVVYIGCGERGNEMTDVLREFPALHDPRTGGSIMQRTVLIANTSDMPVAAREASIYTGIAIGEYYRDMGYAVAVIADSTSRWAEALREMSARLEEMPGEEGYPAYLASRLAQFYERAGLVQTLGNGERYGSLTAIGAVSPPGGDTSEPVSQATMRIVKAFWGLDRSLAYARHFPAIHWLTSYSLYTESLASWFHDHVHPDWMTQRAEALAILQREAELEEVVKMVGRDALDPEGQLTLETAKMIREDFLQQNGFVDVDWFSAFDRQYRLLHLILRFDALGRKALDEGLSPTALPLLPVRERIGRAKMIPNAEYTAAYAAMEMDMEAEIKQAVEKARDADA